MTNATPIAAAWPAVVSRALAAVEAVTGERVRPEREREHGKDGKSLPGVERKSPDTSAPAPPEREIEPEASRQKATEPEPRARGKVREIDLGL